MFVAYLIGTEHGLLILFFLLYNQNEVFILKELGDYLSDVRKNNGVGIEEASDDLNISSSVLENIESGNTRAFRDMLELKETVKKYAKYLGLDPEKVVDEFNDFLFEHTSKINLSDILEAEQMNNKKNEKEVFSPYTKPTKLIKVSKNNYLFYLIPSIILLFIVLVLILRLLIIPKKTIVNNELKGISYLRGDIYEYAK